MSNKKKSVKEMWELGLKAKEFQAQKQQAYDLPDAVKELMPKESQEILRHFGIDAPNLLNRYCCTLEDALIEQVNKCMQYREKCLALSDEILRLRELLPEESKTLDILQKDE